MYLSDVNNLSVVMELTDLALDELEAVVGRFNKRSHRAGLLIGQLSMHKGVIVIKHHFTKKILWKKD